MELEQRGMDFTENYKVYLILSSLPEDYDVLVTSLESLSERDLTLEYLTGRMLEEEERRYERSQVRMRDDIPQQRRAASRSNREQTGKALAVRSCFKCVSEKHLQRNCREKETSWRSGGKKQGRISLVQASDNSKVKTWILENEAVCRLTYKSDLFSSLGASKHSYVSLANGEK